MGLDKSLHNDRGQLSIFLTSISFISRRSIRHGYSPRLGSGQKRFRRLRWTDEGGVCGMSELTGVFVVTKRFGIQSEQLLLRSLSDTSETTHGRTPGNRRWKKTSKPGFPLPDGCWSRTDEPTTLGVTEVIPLEERKVRNPFIGWTSLRLRTCKTM